MAIQKDRYGTQKEDVNAKYPFEGKDNVELARLAQEAESSDFWKEYMVHIKDMIELKNRGQIGRAHV